MKNVNTLVTVAGHATYFDSVKHVPGDPTGEQHWYLQPFQRGEIPFYLNHMRRGVELVAANESSIGLMSGGRTRLAGGKWSEAHSYLETARHYDFWQQTPEAIRDAGNRFDEEIFARDSLENVLFSLLQYRRTAGSMPLRFMMVGWEEKERRFKHHANTLGIPDGVFQYVAVPVDAYGCTAPPPDESAFARGEKNALAQWEATPLGDRGPLLVKREERNPFGVTPPYSVAEYAAFAYEAGWQPGPEVQASAAIIDASAA